MCFNKIISDKEEATPKITKEAMTVYKVMRPRKLIGIKKVASIVYPEGPENGYELGKTYTARSLHYLHKKYTMKTITHLAISINRPIIVAGTGRYAIRVHEGFHSFTTIEAAKIYVQVQKCLSNGPIVTVKCLIPKNTEYLINESESEAVSVKIRFKEIVGGSHCVLY